MSNEKTKIRLDQRVVDEGIAPTKTKAQGMIMAGEILVDDIVVSKPGHPIKNTQVVTHKFSGPQFVSRGGFKLAGALDAFHILVEGKRCLDVGSSTGGFTDCLLQRGAAHVYAMDVGTAQLDQSLRIHPQVSFQENFHVRDLSLSFVGEVVDLIVADVSFISLLKVLPYLLPVLKSEGELLTLIKPQFECQAKDLVKGILKNETKRQEILHDIQEHARMELKLIDVKISDSVLKGPKGNQETFLYGIKV